MNSQEEQQFTIKFTVLTQNDILPFQISLISCYDDIIALRLNVNVQTLEEFEPTIRSMKLLNGVHLNIHFTDVTGFKIPNNCIILPNALQQALTTDEELDICNELVKPFSEDLAKEIDKIFETKFEIPKWIILFQNFNVQEMNFFLSTILYRMDMIEEINKKVKEFQK